MKRTTFFLSSKLVLLFIITALLFIADSSTAQISSIKVKSKDWQQFFNNEFVLISYRYDECHDVQEGIHNENVYIRIVNITGQKLKIEWNTEYWYNDICYGCEAGNTENYKVLTLEPNQQIEGSCGGKNQNELRLLSKMLNFNKETVLTNFNLRDFKVTPILN